MSEQACPQCGAAIPVNEGFLTWCHVCGWNVSAPPVAHEATGRLARLYDRVGRKLGDRLADQVVEADASRRASSPARIGAYAVATAVHLLSLGLLVGGVALAVLTSFNPFLLVISVIAVGTAILMRPRLGTVPKEGVLEGADAPALHGFVDEVAAALGTRSIDVLVVDDEYNASWQIVGIRRRRVLTLGLPLQTALDPPERVALVAHELAHGRNGDSTRGLFVGSSIRGLAELYDVLAPPEMSAAAWREVDTFDRVVSIFLWIVSRPVLGVLFLQVWLATRDAQRAEYMADALAADVAGTPGAVSLQEKVLLASTFLHVVQRAAHEKDLDADIFDRLAQAVRTVPAREVERRRHVARLEGVRLTDHHPPTGHRIHVLERRPGRAPRVTLDPATSATIDREVEGRRQTLQHKLLDDYRDSLYYG